MYLGSIIISGNICSIPSRVSPPFKRGCPLYRDGSTLFYSAKNAIYLASRDITINFIKLVSMGGGGVVWKLLWLKHEIENTRLTIIIIYYMND